MFNNYLLYLLSIVLFSIFSIVPAGVKAEPLGTVRLGDLSSDMREKIARHIQQPSEGSPVTVDAAFKQEKKIFSSDGTDNDFFGHSVSVDGDVAVVGARVPEAVYIFYRNQGGPDNWGQVKKLTTTDVAAEMNESMTSDGAGSTSKFGYSVSVSGDTLVVGAIGVDVGPTVDQGLAYVYYRNQGGEDNWGLVKRLTASDGTADDQYGVSVLVSGDAILVGAIDAAAGGNPEGGAVYVYYRDLGGDGRWGEVKKLIAPDGVSGDFGRYVSLSGDIVVVGNNYAEVDGRVKQGAAYMFYRDQGGADNWGSVKTLTVSDGTAGDEFGYSGDVSEKTVVVGARLADVAGKVDQGAVYVFRRDKGGENNWGEVQKLTTSDGAAGDMLGDAASLSGETIVAGADKADANGQADAGAVYIFSNSQGRQILWFEVDKLIASDGSAGDALGRSVATFNGSILTGAENADLGLNADQGAAYVFVGPKLIVQKDGEGTGLVTDDLSGLDCGDDCNEAYMDYTRVTLTGAPDEGSALDGWTGPDCPGNGICRLNMIENTTVTATFNPDTDGDGISDVKENAGPNDGDANQDGILDSLQADVATFPDIYGLWCTLLVEDGLTLKQVRATMNPSPDGIPEDQEFPAGFFGFAIHGLIPDGRAEATLIMHELQGPMEYYRYGPSRDNNADHWELFDHNGATGVLTNLQGNRTQIEFDFRDGKRGDDDLQADGVIHSQGGPVTDYNAPPSGGHCFISAMP